MVKATDFVYKKCELCRPIEYRWQDVHTSRLAFYSRMWEDKEFEVRRQILHDTEKFVPDEFIALDHNPYADEGYAIEVRWEGFPSECNTIKPIDNLFEDMPNKVLRWLLENIKKLEMTDILTNMKD